MAEVSARKRIWGWFFFDWASQPYNTLLLTFIFGPYVKEMLGDGTAAQSAWGFGIGAAGIIIAVFAPVLGAMADTSGNRLKWVWFFSALYVIGAFGLWWAAPDNFNLLLTLMCFAVGLIGMEFATIFTNSMLPDLGTREQIGRISGNGWAFGYVGGLLSLVAMLTLFAENSETGKTLLGIDPIFGLDAATREGTRFVGPLTALWYAVFMIPFFLYVRDPKTAKPRPGAVGEALAGLRRTLRTLPQSPSLLAYLGVVDVLPRRAERDVCVWRNLRGRRVGLERGRHRHLWYSRHHHGYGLRLVGRPCRQHLRAETRDHRLRARADLRCHFDRVRVPRVGVRHRGRGNSRACPTSPSTSSAPSSALRAAPCNRQPHDDGATGQSGADDRGVRALRTRRQGVILHRAALDWRDDLSDRTANNSAYPHSLPFFLSD